MTRQISAAETRIIRFLKQGGCELQDSVRETHALLVGEQGTIAASRLEIERMRKAGTIQCDGQRIALSAMGRKRPKEQKKPAPTAALSGRHTR
ncbi:hypothetical protein BR141012304_10015 [Brucella inopinata]|nr:hypothetical protein BR141012304_10015 [Brucella inopinata]